MVTASKERHKSGMIYFGTQHKRREKNHVVIMLSYTIRFVMVCFKSSLAYGKFIITACCKSLGYVTEDKYKQKVNAL